MSKHITEMSKTEFNRRYTDKKTKLNACRCFPCSRVFEVEGMEEAFCPKCGTVLSKVGYLEEEKEPSDDSHTLCRNVKNLLSFPLVVKEMRKKRYKIVRPAKDLEDIFSLAALHPISTKCRLAIGNELSCYGINGGDFCFLEKITDSKNARKNIDDYVGMFVQVKWYVKGEEKQALRRVVRSEFDGQIHLATGSADVDWTTCTGPEKERNYEIIAVLRNVSKSNRLTISAEPKE